MISLQNVYKSFGTHHVLNGFSLEVREGETMVIIGYSGTGKSVAIKHIVGLLEPDKGTVFVDDLEVPKLKRRELYALRSHIGYVFQFAALFDSLSVNDNVAMGLVKAGTFTPKEIADRVQEALELVDLPEAGDTSPIELSGGMRKRVGIARAIAHRPKYMLYDEPTTGLDPVTAAVIDEAHDAHAEATWRHQHRQHARHAQRVSGWHAHRDAVRGEGAPGRDGRRDQELR